MDPDPDPTNFSAIGNKHSFVIHHITDKKFSSSPIKPTVAKHQREKNAYITTSYIDMIPQ